MFQFVAVTSRPLRVKELAKLLAFDFRAGLAPGRSRRRTAVQVPTWLAIIDSGYPYGNAIQLSRSWVEEFLTSACLSEKTDRVLRYYHVSMTPAHTLAA